MVEITSQHYLNTTRGVETSRPISVNFNTGQAPSSAENVTTEEEPTPAQERQQRQYEQQVERQLQQLQSRDREVRAHEAAHVAAGGQHVAGGPSFTYQRGPNGRFYAIGGEVQIDTSPVAGNPQATLDKAEVIQRAALAPAQPSAQDRQVASNAARLASRARLDIAIQQREQQQEKVEEKAAKEAGEGESVADVNESSSTGAGYETSSLAEPAKDVFDIVA